jgi:hypothetical protein
LVKVKEKLKRKLKGKLNKENRLAEKPQRQQMQFT